MIFRQTILLTVVSSLLISASSAADSPVAKVVRIDPAITHGTWEGWGVSLAWWAKVFGDRQDLADAVFTTKPVTLEGKLLPGLGLNIVRYNAGASSWNEIDGRKMKVSKIIQQYRQIEGFWLDGRKPDPASSGWNWAVDVNQRKMLAHARARGANHLELFSNSPMWWMTRNDNPSGGAKASDDNLAEAHERDFAIYLAEVARHAKEQWGITFTTVSPFNEPNSDWWFADCKQEGCHVSTAAQARVLPLLREELDRRGLKETPIAASDETHYDHAVRTWETMDATTRALIGQVNVHGYQEAGGRRDRLYQLAHVEAGKRLWNSEYGDGDASGLNMARNLHRDMAVLHPTAWSYWQVVDGGGWGLLQGNPARASIRNVNPKWHVLAQYTRHLKPGSIILETGDESTVAGYDPDAKQLVLIVLNDSDEPRLLSYDLSGSLVLDGPAKRWLTEPSRDSRYLPLPQLPATGSALSLTIPGKSVETLVIGATLKSPR